MAKRQVLAVTVEELFNTICNQYFQGFLEERGQQILKRLMNDSIWRDKDLAEKDEDWKQIIGYCVITDFAGNIFAYKRSKKTAEYEEKRLQGKWSWGIGGHIEFNKDVFPDIIRKSAMREFKEEVECDGSFLAFENVGLINDDSNEVGRVHFGVLFMVHVIKDCQVLPKDPEIENGGFKNIAELEKIITTENVEEWSKIIYPFLRRNISQIL